VRNGITLFILLVYTLSAGAQIGDATINSEGKRISFISGMLFNNKDFFFDFGLGYENLTAQWAIRLDVDFRPFFKKVQIKNEDGSIDQFFERKTLLGIAAEKRLLQLPVGSSTFRFLVGAKGGVMFGNYRGLRRHAEILPYVSPYAGAAFDIGSGGMFKFGYSFMDLQNPRIPQHRIFFGITFYLTEL